LLEGQASNVAEKIKIKEMKITFIHHLTIKNIVPFSLEQYVLKVILFS